MPIVLVAKLVNNIIRKPMDVYCFVSSLDGHSDIVVDTSLSHGSKTKTVLTRQGQT